MSDRVSLFVDGQNLLIGAWKYEDGGLEYDVEELRAQMVGDDHYVGGCWCDAYLPGEGSDREPFFGFLRHNGFDVYTTVLVETSDGSKEKESDLRLAVEMVAGAFQDVYDRAVLVTGDRDFLPAIEKVQTLGRPVTVASFETALARDLADQADDVVRIDDIAEDIRR